MGAGPESLLVRGSRCRGPPHLRVLERVLGCHVSAFHSAADGAKSTACDPPPGLLRSLRHLRRCRLIGAQHCGSHPQSGTFAQSSRFATRVLTAFSRIIHVARFLVKGDHGFRPLAASASRSASFHRSTRRATVDGSWTRPPCRCSKNLGRRRMSGCRLLGRRNRRDHATVQMACRVEASRQVSSAGESQREE